MSEAIKKENIIDMPDNSDMIAEAMKEVTHTSLRLSTQLTISKLSTSCPNTSRKSSIKNTAPTGTAWWAKISAPLSATKPRTISSSMRDNSPFFSTKLDDHSPLICYHQY